MTQKKLNSLIGHAKDLVEFLESIDLTKHASRSEKKLVEAKEAADYISEEIKKIITPTN